MEMALSRNTFVSYAAAGLVAGAALGCSDPSAPGSSEINDVAVIGVVRTVTIGQTLQFEGRASTEDGTRVDGFVTWSVSNASRISVTGELVTVGSSVINRATVTGLAAGNANLIATAGTQTASVLITVSPPVH